MTVRGAAAADHRGRKNPPQQPNPTPPFMGMGENPEGNPQQFDKIDGDNRKDSAELNQYRKALPEITLAEIEESFRQQQMARRGHRKEFRDALDDTENHRPQRIRHHCLSPL